MTNRAVSSWFFVSSVFGLCLVSFALDYLETCSATLHWLYFEADTVLMWWSYYQSIVSNLTTVLPHYRREFRGLLKQVWPTNKLTLQSNWKEPHINPAAANSSSVRSCLDFSSLQSLILHRTWSFVSPFKIRTPVHVNTIKKVLRR